METLRRIDVARRQIDAAIGMLFSGVDPLAVITVGHAAVGILTKLADPENGMFTLSLRSVFGTTEEARKDFWNRHNEVPNFLKHAHDGDSEAAIDAPGDGLPEAYIGEAVAIYAELLNEKVSPSMAGFVQWFYIMYPVAQPGTAHHVIETDARVAEMRSLPRERQLQIGAMLVASAIERDAAKP